MSGNDRFRIEGAILLRVLGSMAIVLLHTMNISELLWKDQISLGEDRLSMAIVYSMMWAVPVFLMVSGALLLDPAREISVKKIYSVYMLRVIAALAVFVLIFSIFDTVMDKKQLSVAVIWEALYKFISNGSWSHLWYLYLLAGLYLLLPAYRMIAAACDEKLFGYLFIIGLIFLSVIPAFESMVTKIAFDIEIPSVYILYFFAGYGISSGKLRVPQQWGLMMFVIGNGMSLLLMIFGWMLPGSAMDMILSSYASPAVMLESLGLFTMLWNCRLPEGTTRVLNILDNAGFGVYLIHVLPLRLILKYTGLNPYREGWSAFILIWAGCFSGSVLLTALLKRIPPVRRIL